MIMWIDVNGKKYTSSQITDTHLKNIINLIARGGGHDYFLTHERVDNLYDEALQRGLKLKVKRKDLKLNVSIKNLNRY